MDTGRAQTVAMVSAMGDSRFFNDIEGAPGADVLRIKQERLLARIRVEYGPALAGRGDDIERLRQEVSQRMRGLLNFAPAVEMVAPDTFEKPGVHKVALVVREDERRIAG